MATRRAVEDERIREVVHFTDRQGGDHHLTVIGKNLAEAMTRVILGHLRLQQE